MLNYENLLRPKEIDIEGKTFCISKFPATDGREIVTTYFSSNMPKIGDPKLSDEMMSKLMSFVAAKNNDNSYVVLQNKTLVNSFLSEMTNPWQSLAKIEMAMMEYNCSFFQEGRVSSFLEDIAQKVHQKASEILTPLLEKLSMAEKPPSTN